MVFSFFLFFFFPKTTILPQTYFLCILEYSVLFLFLFWIYIFFLTIQSRYFIFFFNTYTFLAPYFWFMLMIIRVKGFVFRVNYFGLSFFFSVKNFQLWINRLRLKYRVLGILFTRVGLKGSNVPTKLPNSFSGF